jgi:hypothetical protein
MMQPIRRMALLALVWALAGSVSGQTASADPGAAATPAAAPQGAASAAPTHRSMRLPLPQMDALPAPTVPETFAGYQTYPGAPPFSVVSRKPEVPLYPCSMCHNLQKLNTTVRQFKVAPPPDGAPHAGVLRHGKGRMWCLDCHLAQDREWLHLQNGAKLDVDDSPQLCGQCHSARFKDWIFGGHGKRVAGWTGERQLYACTHCHDPHVPQILPRAAAKPPPVRAGLQAMGGTRDHAALPWQHPPQGHVDGPQAKP